MTTVKAFNEMMGQFLDELSSTFPEEEAVKTACGVTRTRETFETFMKQVSPYSNDLMQKNEAFFCDENEFVKKLNLKALWTSEGVTANTKDAIWQYIQTMYILGTTINMFPPETLSMIETAAEACAKNMQAQGPNIDEQTLMTGMNNMLTQMLGAGRPPLPPRGPKPTKRRSKK
jgi:flavorubredoxin